MGDLTHTRMSHLLSLFAVLVFGLMALSCLELENLDPFEAAILWAFPQEPVECETLEDGPINDFNSIKFTIVEAITGKRLEGVAVDVTFTFYAYEWTGEFDDEGDPLCLKELVVTSETASGVTDQFGITDYINSPIVAWSDANDVMVISWTTTKLGYTSAIGSISTSSQPARIFNKLLRLGELDSQ